MEKEALYEKLANLMFPDVVDTIEDLETRYPKRDLKEGAEVTRFAPSPTGFLHSGALYGSTLDMKIARQSGGVFYLRIEDTDTKREVEGSVKDIIEQLKAFGIESDEGPIDENTEMGNYGPYKQSARRKIYETCAKELVRRGRAYPCFCSAEDLDTLRASQEKNKQITGYYGIYARCRNNSVEDMIKRVEAGETYVVRFRSNGSHMKKVSFIDSIRGKIEMADNDQDIVIIKSDGLPTYHFAHAVDDHFMRTTTVIRGEEWIPSTALHLELFSALGFEHVKYAHTPTIMKNDNGAKRKLSKRKDPEASVAFFLESGYPVNAMNEYLLTILNSNYEPWRIKNPDANINEFGVKLDKINSAGALFDLVKITDISKNIIAKMKSTELLEALLNWSKVYDEKLYNILNRDLVYAKNILAIERDDAVKIRKDFGKYTDVLPSIFYFYDDLFDEDTTYGYNFDYAAKGIKDEDVIAILDKYIEIYDENDSKDEWFSKIKVLTESLGFAANMKEYKLSPENFKGSIADVTGVLRVAICNRQNSPDIYALMSVMKKDRVIKRLEKAMSFVKGE